MLGEMGLGVWSSSEERKGDAQHPGGWLIANWLSIVPAALEQLSGLWGSKEAKCASVNMVLLLFT